MKRKTTILIATIFFFYFKIFAQSEDALFVKDAIKANREKTYSNIVKNSITKNLSLPLTDSTEENWQDAFYAMELINYKAPWVEGKIKIAFNNIERRSIGFQRALLELLYTNYKGKLLPTVDTLMQKTPDPKIFAMAAEYYIAASKDANPWDKVIKYFTKRMDKDKGVPVFYGLLTGLMSEYSDKKTIAWFINNIITAVPGHTLLISFQRKNRNYPGLAIIRDAGGNFIKNDSGNIFSVPQLARSMSNMPFYLTNGNTPQGFFRMHGFDVSKSMAIGPTTNIQLMMPYETSPQNFLNEPGMADTVWAEDIYKRLIPESLKDYMPLYESFYASKAGRTEIIAHGTTVNTEYYKGQPWYPYTPTEGCLCTKEIWSTITGKRVESDQQKLVNALRAAGGANGYCLVIELDNQQQPVTLQEIAAYLREK